MKAILNLLKTIQPPKMIREALALYGTLETIGSKSNPAIVAWAKETNTKDDNWYDNDATPWCGLFMAVVAQRAGKEVPNECLRALAWASFGTPVPVAMLGDVLVFKRTGGGHVGMYVAEDANYYYVLGGNQSDKVCIAKIDKKRIYAIRRPIYAIGQPASVKQYFASGGAVSENEA